MLWFVKESDDLISWCRCPVGAVAALPNPAGCPWCGCGWLWSCADCRKAFTFARLAEVPGDAAALVSRDLNGFGLAPPFDPGLVAAGVADVARHTAGRAAGPARYVHLDARVAPVDAWPLALEGERGVHLLPRAPHAAALAGDRTLLAQLESRAYWDAAAARRSSDPAAAARRS